METKRANARNARGARIKRHSEKPVLAERAMPVDATAGPGPGAAGRVDGRAPGRVDPPSHAPVPHLDPAPQPAAASEPLEITISVWPPKKRGRPVVVIPEIDQLPQPYPWLNGARPSSPPYRSRLHALPPGSRRKPVEISVERILWTPQTPLDGEPEPCPCSR